jgi:hypothetical protein|tara:strand:+ start:1539 stop:1730 length:192 start_codon:yes stop_codon:yes gene_type:complete
MKDVMEEGIIDELYDLDNAGDLKLDQRINEYGIEHNLHADDDRDTIIQGIGEEEIELWENALS